MTWQRLAMVGLSFTALCGSLGSASRTPETRSQFVPVATVQEIMDAQIDPSADALWDAVAIISTPGHTETRQPRTDEEWNSVRRSALTLIEATTLLAMEGRRVSSAKGKPAPGELSPAEIQRRLDSNPAYFAQFAYGLRLASLEALKAIDARDTKALMDAGDLIDQACEACHVAYWYPPQ